MRQRLIASLLTISLTLGFATASLSQDSKSDDSKPAFSFGDVEFFHRFTKKEHHEYTPNGQDDLKKWEDMVTINYYPDVKDGEALAAKANAVLGNYQAARGVIVRTDSVPRTEETPAEHLIVVAFAQPDVIEVAFARFRMHDGIGTAIIYSHRLYGEQMGDETSNWLKENGPTTEKSLMQWDEMPDRPVSKD